MPNANGRHIFTKYIMTIKAYSEDKTELEVLREDLKIFLKAHKVKHNVGCIRWK